MFSPALFFLFTQILTEHDYKQLSSPKDIITAVSKLSSNIDDIVNKTGAAREDVERIFNFTIPCLQKRAIENLSMHSLTNVLAARYDIADCFSVDEEELICLDNDTNAMIFWLIQLCAIVFQIIMSFFHRRKANCLWCCWGRPGIVIPLNMLDSYENRWGMALTFILTVSQCQAVLLSKYERLFGDAIGDEIKALPRYTSVFMKVACALIISQTAYPFFVCQRMKNKVVGSIIGLFLTILWLSLEIARLVDSTKTCWVYWEESGFGRKYGILSTLYDWPLYIALVVLFVKFSVVIVKTVLERQKKCLIERGQQLMRVKNFNETEFGQKFESKTTSVLKKLEIWMKHDDTDFKKEYMYTHVKNLFKRIPKVEEDDEEMRKMTITMKFKTKLKSKLYAYKPEFQYSTRMIASMLVAALVNYMYEGAVTLYIADKLNTLDDMPHKLVATKAKGGLVTEKIWKICAYLTALGYVLFIKYWKKLFTENVIKFISTHTNIADDLIEDYVYSTAAAWWMAIITAVFFSLLVMLNSCAWYRKHILLLRRGDRTFLPKEFRSTKRIRESAVDLMTASLKFAGFQVGYAAWGFLLLFGVLLLAYFIFITQIVVAIKRRENSILVDLFIQYWPTIFLAIVMVIVQKQLAQRVFLLEDQSLAVANRRTFHIVSYIYFFFNAFLGIASSALRLIYGLIFGVLFMQRLQKSTLPRTLEIKDPGYMAYIGYILTEHQHANPVVHCFVRILTESIHKTFLENEKTDHAKNLRETGISLVSACLEMEDVNSINARVRKQTKAVIRWHLFVMLEQNPSLRQYRKEVLNTHNPKRLIRLLIDEFRCGGKKKNIPKNPFQDISKTCCGCLK